MTLQFKDPDAVRPIGVSWRDFLDTGETVATAVWTVESGLTLVSDALNTSAITDPVDGSTHGIGLVAVAWLSGGTAGRAYSVSCRMTSSLGRVEDQTITVRVRQR